MERGEVEHALRIRRTECLHVLETMGRLPDVCVAQFKLARLLRRQGSDEARREAIELLTKARDTATKLRLRLLTKIERDLIVLEG